MEQTIVEPKRNLDVLNDAACCVMLIDIALQFGNDRKFSESVLRKAKTHLENTADCLAKTTILANTLLNAAMERE